MAISSRQRRFLVFNYAVVPAILNFLLGAAGARLLFHSHVLVTVKPDFTPGADPLNVDGDVFSTAFLLPLMAAWIIAPLAVLALRHGQIDPIREADSPAFIRLLAAFSVSAGGALLGVLAMILYALPVAWTLSAHGISQMPYHDFFWLKATNGAALSVIFLPWIGWSSLVRASEEEQRRSDADARSR
jgi:hypothetical protein